MEKNQRQKLKTLTFQIMGKKTLKNSFSIQAKRLKTRKHFWVRKLFNLFSMSFFRFLLGIDSLELEYFFHYTNVCYLLDGN